jgi:AraC-like DNA-binding protein
MANESAKGVDHGWQFECQNELLDLYDLLVDVIFCMKNVDGVYVAVNRAFVRRTGRSSKRDVVGKRAGDLFIAPLAERYEEQDSEVFSSGKPMRDQLELIRREDASLGWYLTTKLPVASRVDPGKVAGLVSISRDLATPSDEGITMESLHRVVELVHDRLAEPLRVADLAEAAGCSTSSLERRMKRVFGVTATQFVLRSRVDRANRLLTTTDLPLAEIATTVGFYDQADFTRRFARLTNETPAQFRRRHGP